MCETANTPMPEWVYELLLEYRDKGSITTEEVMAEIQRRLAVKPTQEANARLIAAAPVLLDTLTRIAHHATVGHGSLDVGDISAAHDDFALINGVAQAAIATAKAKGE